MSQLVKLKKGLNLKLQGLAEKVLVKISNPESYAVKPTDFHGVTPKLLVKEGDEVKAGTPLFCDKNRPEIVFVSPTSGTLTNINRGDRRKILEIVVTPDGKNDAIEHSVPDLAGAKRDKLIELMLNSGAWPFLKQRPYGIIADPTATPKAIFISGFDSAPIAADADFLVNGEDEMFQKGIDVLRRLTSGQVYLSLCADYPANNTFEKAKGVVITRFKGPHPAGNVGVQIHHLNPINKGELVWTITPQHVIALGRLFTQGIYDASKVIAIVGSEVKKPRYYRMFAGASLKCLADLINKENNPRVISGNVFTGANVGL
ncbi:MAG: NADH:ubiquinone reductase (Na(+)-transporting) subunit A, partial [Prevotellaceae bacterium]|nr:NADH:ubiquinone reductase (Na(+)-transporting) subunit A [Prevotellaceae bacterium]